MAPQKLKFDKNPLNLTMLELPPLLSTTTIKNLTDLVNSPNATWEALYSNYKKTHIDHLDDQDLAKQSVNLQFFGVGSLPFTVEAMIFIQLGLDVGLIFYFGYKVLVHVLSRAIMKTHLQEGMPMVDHYSSVGATPVGSRPNAIRDNPFRIHKPTVPTTTTTQAPTTVTYDGLDAIGSLANDSLSQHLSVSLSVMHDKLFFLYNLIEDMNSTLLHVPKNISVWRSVISKPEGSNVQGWVVMFIIMILVAIVCHHLLTSNMQAIVRKSALQCGALICNRTVTHHASETQLVMGILVNYCRSMQKDGREPKNVPCSKQVIYIQVCTLPHGRTEYCLDNQGALSDFIQTSYSPRWRSTMKFRLNWGPVCLKLKEDPTLELCKDLPTTVELAMKDLSLIASERTPSFWTQIIVVSITEISLLDHTGKSMLYLPIVNKSFEIFHDVPL